MCAALGEHAAGGAAGGAEGDLWWRTCLGHTHALGRLHWADFSLQTVEMVAEGSEGIAPSVREAVFAPMRQMRACLGE